MKYFGLVSLLLVVTVGIVWSVSSLSGGQLINQTDDSNQPAYQEAIESAQDAAGSISESGTVRIEIYDGRSFTPETTVVDFSNENLSGSLRAEIRKLSDLEVLDISNNNFTDLPAEVGQLYKLKVLNVSHNPLTGLPREIGQLQNLEVFDVSGVSYSPEDLAAITDQFASSTVIITQ